MGEAGRAFVEKNYDRRKLARKYLGVVEKITAQPQRRGLIVSRKGAKIIKYD